MAHGDAREKWRGNWWMEWVASTLHTTSQHGLSSITTADAHTSFAISRLTWRPRRFKRPRPFRRKTKSGFCACAITFQTQSTTKVSQAVRPFSHFELSLSACINYWGLSNGSSKQGNAILRDITLRFLCKGTQISSTHSAFPNILYFTWQRKQMQSTKPFF